MSYTHGNLSNNILEFDKKLPEEMVNEKPPNLTHSNQKCKNILITNINIEKGLSTCKFKFWQFGPRTQL